MFMMDPVYFIILLPAMVLAAYAQYKVSTAFRKYSRVPNRRGASGRDIAEAILLANGIMDVPVEMTGGMLSDHYDPVRRVLRLSPAVYSGRSVAALGVAAHEAGHALQHAGGYVPLHFRSMIVPLAGIGSNLAWLLFFIGLFLVPSPLLLNLAVLLFAGTVLFTLVTLPVEFNASRRAVAQLVDGGIIDMDEEYGVRRVLNAAALTYVAAALMAILQLLYMLMRARR